MNQKSLKCLIIGLLCSAISSPLATGQGTMLDIRGKAPWVMFHGFYWGYEYSNLAKYGQPDRLPGTLGKMEVLNFAISLKNTNLAIGGSLVEGHLVKGTEPEGVTFKESIKGTPTSWVPVYMYYPILIKMKQIEKGPFRGESGNTYSFAYLGGSGWGMSGNKYLNAGLKLGYYLSASDLSGVTTGGPYINIGLFQMLGDSERQRKTGYYFTIGANLIGIVNLK